VAKKETSLTSGLKNPENDRIKRWRWLLNQEVPIIGGWMHEHVLLSMAESALTGNALAVQSISMALARHKEAEVKQLAAATLRKINFASGIDAAWSVWVDTRDAALEQILREKKRTANNPSSVRLLSALCLEDMDTVTRGSADLVPALISATRDHNPQIAARARQGIRALHNPASIDSLCRIWLEKRQAFLAEIMKEAGYVAHKPARVRAYSALKIDRPEVLMQASPEMVPAIVEACGDSDPDIAARARRYLLHLQSQPAVDAFCRLWSETRSPLSEETLLKAGYKAHLPLKVHLLVALKTGQDAAAESIPPAALNDLIEATQDADPIIQSAANKAMNRLKLEETQEALAMRFIESGDPLAREVSIAQGYAPREAEMRALFFFLTGQWSAYDDLDYDQSLMRIVYEGAGHDLRQRIAAQVQAAGRTPYLTILAGMDYRSRADEVNPNEAALLIRVLAQNKEWNRLWALAPELALPFSVRIVQILADAGWQPEDELDRQAFSEMVELARRSMILSTSELSRVLPQAMPRASLKVQGRVNEVAFSPTDPVLAIATSSRKVVLWNFQTASIVKVLDGFHHSVGRLAYLPDGTLCCGERTNTLTQCAIVVYHNHETYQIHNHEGSITVLEPVGQYQILTAGRDGKVTLWDVASRQLIKEIRVPVGWARNASVAPDQQSFALLEDRLQLYRLPDLRPIPGQPYIAPRANYTNYKKGKASLVTFSPDGKYIITGQHNGQVALYFHNSLTQRPPRNVVTEFQKPVRGIHFLPRYPILVTAGAEGSLRFLRWPELSPLGVQSSFNDSDTGQMTSLHISANGSFMATGTNDAFLRLWDMRVLDIPDLFSKPLANATHDQIDAIIALGEYITLPEPVRNGLKFLRLLLQYRFRFDIHIEEVPSIQFGEFDIIVDEEGETKEDRQDHPEML